MFHDVRAQVFEEEDFQPMSYGYRLGSNPQMGNTYDASLEVTEAKCISLLREQEEELNKKAMNSGGKVNITMLLSHFFKLYFIKYF